MCTLAVLFRVHASGPLVVAANRDEWLARPASPFGVLRQAPLTLGGRDEEAGGTWLAVNEHGVVAALTNQPGGRDAARRSRGELPLLLTEARTAREAVAAFVATARSEAWNACWMLVGDRESLHYLPIEGTGAPVPIELGPGVHVLENRPLLPPSRKASRIADEVGRVAARAADGDELLVLLGERLAEHDGEETEDRPLELEATCVHAGLYGTRSATLVVVPAAGEPRVLASDGPPCVSSFRDRGELWLAGL